MTRPYFTRAGYIDAGSIIGLLAGICAVVCGVTSLVLRYSEPEDEDASSKNESALVSPDTTPDPEKNCRRFNPPPETPLPRREPNERTQRDFVIESDRVGFDVEPHRDAMFSDARNLLREKRPVANRDAIPHDTTLLHLNPEPDVHDAYRDRAETHRLQHEPLSVTVQPCDRTDPHSHTITVEIQITHESRDAQTTANHGEHVK